MPPPMTSSRSGMPSTSSAPVESMTRSSCGRNGSEAAREPAAMIACVEADDGAADLDRVRRGELAHAAHDLDLALLGQRLEAAGELADDAVLARAHASMSIFGAPKRDAVPRPSSAASAITLATCSSALDGMQPTFRHTPPSARRARPGRRRGRGRRRGTLRRSRRAGAEHGDLHADVGRPTRRAGRRRRSAGASSSLGHLFAPVPRRPWPRQARASSVSSAEPSATLSPTATFTSVTLLVAARGSPSSPCRTRARPAVSTPTSSPTATEHLDDGTRRSPDVGTSTSMQAAPVEGR